MRNLNISKEALLAQVTQNLLVDRPVECSFDLLRFAFGFRRVPGEEFMLAKLLRPSVTEESMSYLPKHEIIQNILDWAKENGFGCCYNGNYSMNDTFTFYEMIKKEPL